jgi:hypothetical protein
MPFQVGITWDDFVPLPAFDDRSQAIHYAKGLLARLPYDAHPETEVTVRDENGTEVFVYTLAAWRLAVAITGNAVYEWPKFDDGATGKRKGS